MFRLEKACQLLLTLALTSLVGVGPAGADFYPISTPDATYTSRTSLIPIPASDIEDPWGGGLGDITDGRLTVLFRTMTLGHTGLRRSTWSGNWGIPPLVESTTTQSLGFSPGGI